MLSLVFPFLLSILSIASVVGLFCLYSRSLFYSRSLSLVCPFLLSILSIENCFLSPLPYPQVFINSPHFRHSPFCFTNRVWISSLVTLLVYPFLVSYSKCDLSFLFMFSSKVKVRDKSGLYSAIPNDTCS
jgi:hypothetical protein